MQHHKKNISTFNFRPFRFFGIFLIFLIPIILIYGSLEIILRQIPFSVKIKSEYIQKNKENIEILALGSSLYERGINPEYIDYNLINLGNSSQRTAEHFNLLKRFEPQLPNLNLIILEVSYDLLERGKDLTSPIVDHLNLVFYNTNTFQRELKFQDYLLYSSNPDYFSRQLKDYIFDESPIKLNEKGFDTNKFFGSYQIADHDDIKIKNKDIYIENPSDKDEFKKNVQKLIQIINYCKEKDINIIIYSPPTHYRYNNLRDQTIVDRRDSILRLIKKTNGNIEIFIDEKNPNFDSKLFYNADHLNPDGAKKASQNLNRFIMEKFY